MCSRLVNPWKPLLLIRIALLTATVFLTSGWTCNALFTFSGCEASTPAPQIFSLSPDAVPSDAESTLLIVNGSRFVPQSQIMWNGGALQTTFIDSQHLSATITQQTFVSFGGSAGDTVQIAVNSPGSAAVAGCPNGGSSATLVLDIN